MFYGSGLRSGDANIGHEQPYAQFNVGLTHEFQGWNMKPLTLRFDVVNVFDTLYQIRSGTGIGVFAPQYGPRRGFFAGLADPARVLQIIAGDEPVDLVIAAAIIKARLRPAECAPISRQPKAGIGDARLGLDVHHAGGAGSRIAPAARR